MPFDFAAATAADTHALRSNIVTAGDPVPCFGRKMELGEQLHALACEFSGQPVLNLYHAALIVHVRRELDAEVNFERFRRIWADEAAHLLSSLNARWLVSACDTIADFDPDATERAGAIAAVLLVNTVKLYETERLAIGATGHQYRKVWGRGQGLFDGLTPYAIGHGDMVKNMLDRVRHTPGLCGRILNELIRRLLVHDTVFHRFGAVHRLERTAWMPRKADP
jgi:hypothetical protein